MNKSNKKIVIVRVLYWVLAIIFLISCSPKKSRTPNSTNSPLQDVQNSPEYSESSEIIGEDIAGNKITKTTLETEQSLTIVLITPVRVLKGTVELTGTSQFNELQLFTDDNRAFSFDYQYTERFWSFQSKEIKIKGRTEERTFYDKKTGQVFHKNWLFPAD